MIKCSGLFICLKKYRRMFTSYVDSLSFKPIFYTLCLIIKRIDFDDIYDVKSQDLHDKSLIYGKDNKYSSITDSFGIFLLFFFTKT